MHNAVHGEWRTASPHHEHEILQEKPCKGAPPNYSIVIQGYALYVILITTLLGECPKQEMVEDSSLGDPQPNSQATYGPCYPSNSQVFLHNPPPPSLASNDVPTGVQAS